MAFPRKPGSNEIDIDAFFLLPDSDQKTALIDLYNTGSDSEVALVEARIKEIEDQLPEDTILQLRQLDELTLREIELNKKQQEAQEARQSFSANMLKTLDGVKKDDGTPLTTDEQIALNEKMTNATLELVEEFSQKLNVSTAPIKSQAELEKEKAEKEKAERKRLIKDFDRKLELHMAEKAKQAQNQNLLPQTTQSKTTNNKTTKNRNCTIF